MSNVSTPHRPHIIIGLSGSVAVVKIYELAERLSQFADVKVVYTQASAGFFDPDLLESRLQALAGQATTSKPETALDNTLLHSKRVFCDRDEWSSNWGLGDPVLHIELRKWADLLVLAPLSANTLAKISTGICDNLLTSLLRAWDCTLHTDDTGRAHVKPIIACPAMNTQMYLHPLTSQHLDASRRIYAARRPYDVPIDHAQTDSKTEPTVQSTPNAAPLGTLWSVVEPQVKRLACGDLGIGAMASVENIAQACQERLENPVPLDYVVHIPPTDEISRASESSMSLQTLVLGMGLGLLLGCLIKLR